MNSKLTLTIDKIILVKAKKYAEFSGKNLSTLVENYFKLIVNKTNEKKVEIGPITKSLKGVFKIPEELDYKKELQDAIYRNYLL